MRTFTKIIIAAAAAVIVAIVALAVFAKIIITPERIREAVVPAARKALNRDVQLGDISISFFSGVILHDLRIMERGSDDVFLSAAQATLRYRFLPLLSLRVVIDELRFEEPHITVTRLPDGTFNFSDLITGTEQTATPTTARTAPTAQSGGVPVSLTIATVRFNRGSVLFIDTAASAEAPLRHQINSLNMAAHSITLNGAFPFKLECRINDAPLSVDGRADTGNKSISARIDLSNLDATTLIPYIADMLPGSLSRLTANLNAKVEGDINQITSNGTLELRDIDLILNALPEAPIRRAHLSAAFDCTADLNASALQLRSTRLSYNGITAKASGRIEKLDSNPLLALEISAPGLSIAALIAALPTELVADASAMKPTGSIDIEARLEGPTDSAAVLKKADVRLRDVQATLGSMRPTLNGSLQLTGDRLVSQDLVLEAAESRASIDLAAENLFGTPIRTTQRINAERFDIDALLQTSSAIGKGAASNKAPKQAAQTAKEIGPFDVPVSADGTVKITRAVYRGLTINDVNLTYGLADNILTIKKLSGQTAGGTFSQSGRVDLGRKGLAYQSTLSLQNLQFDPVLAAFMPQAAGTLFGNLTLDLDASGQGTLPEALKQNLICASRIDINDGRITGSGLAKGLSGFLGIDELRELTFSTFGGTVDIKQGRAHLDTELISTDVRMSPKGIVGLDGSLDLSLNAALSPALMKKIGRSAKAMSFLTDPQGWSQVPLKIKGTYDHPRFDLDTIGLRQQAEEKILDTLQQRLFDRNKEPAMKDDTRAGGQTQETSSPQNLEEQPEQAQPEDSKTQRKKKREERRKILEDTLQGILGR